jgi:hypothetical protein
MTDNDDTSKEIKKEKIPVLHPGGCCGIDDPHASVLKSHSKTNQLHVIRRSQWTAVHELQNMIPKEVNWNDD